MNISLFECINTQNSYFLILFEFNFSHLESELFE